jgi:hypothetical protein
MDSVENQQTRLAACDPDRVFIAADGAADDPLLDQWGHRRFPDECDDEAIARHLTMSRG